MLDGCHRASADLTDGTHAPEVLPHPDQGAGPALRRHWASGVAAASSGEVQAGMGRTRAASATISWR